MDILKIVMSIRSHATVVIFVMEGGNMTGKELINLIRDNNAEDLPIMLYDQDGGMGLWHYPVTELTIDHIDTNDKHFISYKDGKKVAVIM